VCWDDAGRQTYGIQLSAGATFVDGDVTGNHVSGKPPNAAVDRG
jgi:hypothetical protein